MTLHLHLSSLSPQPHLFVDSEQAVIYMQILGGGGGLIQRKEEKEMLSSMEKQTQPYNLAGVPLCYLIGHGLQTD